MIAAIKVVRVERNLGLKEYRDLVDAYIRSQPSLR
jgi:ribosomal protein L7/L12